MVTVGVLKESVLPTTNTLDWPFPTQPLSSVTTAEYWNCETLGITFADTLAVVAGVVEADTGLTVVVPGPAMVVVDHV